MPGSDDQRAAAKRVTIRRRIDGSGVLTDTGSLEYSVLHKQLGRKTPFAN